MCTDPTVRKAAMETYRAAMRKVQGDFRQCPQPCKFAKGILKLNKERRRMNPDSKGRRTISLQIFFERMVQATKMDYNYGFISLVAELGGYVGLFLGVAVVELHGIFKYILVRLFKLSRASGKLFTLVRWVAISFCVAICMWQAHVCIIDKYLKNIQGVLHIHSHLHKCI